MLRLIAAIFCLMVLSAKQATAYPNYISYGYQSCMVCHYNPYGNGPLTDYGRALSATEISDRTGWSKDATEEQIADSSGFLATKEMADWLRPSLSYRGLLLTRDAGGETEKSEFIPMDVSTAVVTKFLARDRLIIVGQIGYAPPPRAQRGQPKFKTYRSREHYVGYRLTKEIGIYSGLMDKVFGLRVADHIAFSRTTTGLTQYDQSHGALFHYVDKTLEFGIQPFLGNLVQDKDLRQKGVTGQFEYTVGEFTRAGVSALSSSSDYLKILMYAAHLRLGLGKGNSILAEVGEVKRTVRATDIATASDYSFLQGHLHLRRGLWSLLTLETFKPDNKGSASIYRIGPGMQYFPVQRVEIRADAYNTLRQTPGANTATTWDLTAQMHLWL